MLFLNCSLKTDNIFVLRMHNKIKFHLVQFVQIKPTFPLRILKNYFWSSIYIRGRFTYVTLGHVGKVIQQIRLLNAQKKSVPRVTWYLKHIEKRPRDQSFIAMENMRIKYLRFWRHSWSNVKPSTSLRQCMLSNSCIRCFLLGWLILYNTHFSSVLLSTAKCFIFSWYSINFYKPTQFPFDCYARLETLLFPCLFFYLCCLFFAIFPWLFLNSFLYCVCIRFSTNV